MGRPDVSGYELIRQIGIGAKSEIYQAMSLSTGKTVAIKVVRISGPEDRKYLYQVRNEFAIGSELDHPNIVRIHKLDMVRRIIKVVGANLIMEYVDGPDLEKDRNYSIPELIRFYMQVALGLQYLHDNGFIHTDIKPNNIVIHKRRIAKIVDLGISRRCGVPSGRVQGTVQSIAPEQVLKLHLDERTDIYNLGAAFYYVFRGEFMPPPVVPTMAFSNSPHLVKPQRGDVSIRDVNPEVPREVEDIIFRSCQPRPEDRPRNTQEIIDTLEPFIDFETRPKSVAGDQ